VSIVIVCILLSMLFCSFYIWYIVQWYIVHSIGTFWLRYIDDILTIVLLIHSTGTMMFDTMKWYLLFYDDHCWYSDDVPIDVIHFVEADCSLFWPITFDWWCIVPTCSWWRYSMLHFFVTIWSGDTVILFHWYYSNIRLAIILNDWLALMTTFIRQREHLMR